MERADHVSRSSDINMEVFTQKDLKNLYIPDKSSHKGENGKLTIIGGSKLFHGASLWALKVASRIVDMVFYASIPENNELTKRLKTEIFDFIAVPRDEVENYIEESDVVLIGPGLIREQETRDLTRRLMEKFKNKKWIIDAGSLQTMEPDWLRWINGKVIITPHRKEFEELFKLPAKGGSPPKADGPLACASGGKTPRLWRKNSKVEEIVWKIARDYNCLILLKGLTDIIGSPSKCLRVEGGNAGMTKGGTGDVLAGLVAALACKNDLFLAACAASFINKKAGEELFKKVGYYFNATDLTEEIPKVMKQILN